MDIITQSNFEEFTTNFNIIGKSAEESFEDYANYCVLAKHQRTETISRSSVDAIHIGGGNDTGIDGFILIVNGKNVSTQQEVKDLLEANGYLDVKFVLVQTKTSAKFDTAEIGQFLEGAKLVFRRIYEEVEMPPFNDDIRKCYDLVEYIYKNASKFPNGRKPELALYYVTTGNYDSSNKDITSKFHNAVSELQSYNLLSTVSWVAVGAKELMDLYNATKQHDEEIIKIGQFLMLPDIEKVEQGYLFLLPFSEFRKLIIEQETDTIKNVFNDNIRAYQGDTPVNREIGKTLEAKDFSLFTAMNNGITIIAKQVAVTGTRITLTDYQIVNGCQTSHVLFEKRNVEGIDNLNLLVKLIASTDREVRNSIIFGANSQTAVMREQLIALSEVQERIEAYYNAVKDTERLYYERRSKQYRGNNKVPAYKVINIPTQIKAMVSMFLSEPHNVNGYYGCIVEKLQQSTKKIFSDTYQIDIYYTCGYAYYKMMDLFDNQILPHQFKRLKYQLLYAFRLSCDKEFGSMPDFNSHKMTGYCKNINVLLNDASRCKAKFLEAINLLINALGHTYSSEKDLQDENLTENIRKKCYTGNISKNSNIQHNHHPKILGSIDLSSINQNTRPKKKSKKK